MIDSQPDLAPLIRRVRGGYLKIQGTWMPYEVSQVIMYFGGGYRHRKQCQELLLMHLYFLIRLR